MNDIEHARKLLTEITKDLPQNWMLFGVESKDFDEPMLRMALVYVGHQWERERERHSHNLEFLGGLYAHRNRLA